MKKILLSACLLTAAFGFSGTAASGTEAFNPCEYTTHTHYLPYPGDCTKFIICIDGIPYINDCPAGLVWNQEVEHCDFPENVPPCD